MKPIALIKTDGETLVFNPAMFVAAVSGKHGTTVHLAGGVVVDVSGQPLEIAERVAEAMGQAVAPKPTASTPPPPPRSSTPSNGGGRRGKPVNAEQDKKVSAAISWAHAEGEAVGFDPSFVESLANGLEKYGQLTEKQDAALDKVIDKFEIDVERWAKQP